MPRRKKQKQASSHTASPDHTGKGNGLWMILISIFMLICLVTGLFSIQSAQFDPSTQANATAESIEEDFNPDEWLIPLPDVEGMEPQVAQLIQKTHDALVANRNSAQHWGQYAKVLDAHQLYNVAVECYENAQRLEPENIRWKYLLAIALEFQGKDIQRVVNQFKDITRSTELYPPVYLRLGNALLQQGKSLEARDAYRYAVELDESFAMGHRGLGQALLALNEVESALLHLERAVQLSPNDRVVFASLAQAYTRAAKPQKARLAADRAKKLNPDHSIPDTIRYEVDKLAMDSASCGYRGEQHLKAGEFDQALEEFKTVERVFPDDARLHMKIAMVYRAMKRPDDVFAHLKKAVQLKDDSAVAHVQLANYYNKQKKYEDAIKHYEKAVSLKPDQLSLRVELARIFAKIGEFSKANTEFDNAVSLGDVGSDVYADWGTTLALGGNMEEAIKRYTRAIELNPEFADAHFHLGLAYEQVGQVNNAKAAYMRAVEIDPDHRAGDKLIELKDYID